MGTRAVQPRRREGILLVPLASSGRGAPILVTGSHRSGTTWLGRMLCASREAAYVHEPFNPNRSPGWFRAPLPYWFMHITRENEAAFVEDVERMVALGYPLRSVLKARTPRLLAMNVQQAALALRDRRAGKRLLLKDPLALFSAEWLAERFGMRVVIVIRHPASFVSSIKRLNWGFDYEQNWLAQPLLMRDLLAGYESVFTGYRGEVDLVGEGIVVWNAMYDVVALYRERHPDWIFVRYEDLAAAPHARFRALYDELDLSWTDEVERTISEHSSRSNPGEIAADRPHELRRDSAAAAAAWRHRLTQEEIDRIRVGTERVWRRFYASEEWEGPPSAPG